MKAITATLALVALGAVPAAACVTAPAEPVATPAAVVEPEAPTGRVIYPSELPPCDHEDGTVTSGGVPVDACHWDAGAQGNGSGTSFIVIRH